MSQQLYDIKNYTDEQLYAILDMDNPTDRELEAKIIHLIKKYDNMQNEDGNKLAHFFKQIYDHFFDNDENDEDENMIESFDNNNSEPISTNQAGYTSSDPTPQISQVQTLDYSKDKLQLNPLLKQTIKRIISIDSQYRNIATSPVTTNFSFDLSEPLKDVLSLKLYSIQIPYTWYIINKNFGANFFYIKAANPKLAGGNHDYQISIPIGNYSASELITTINDSFKTVKTTTASDIQFSGNTIVSYNPNSSRTTFTLDFKNTYNESYYQIDFSYVMPSAPPTLDIERTTNIASYLGFNYSTYSLNDIHSLQTFLTTPFILSEDQLPYFQIDTSNNYFTVKQYLGPSAYTSTSTILNTYTIQLSSLIPGNYYTRPQIIQATNQAIQSTGIFTTNSNIQQVDISNSEVVNNGYSYFNLTMILDRTKVAYVPNSKLYISFPTENLLGNTFDINQRTIWTYQPNLYSSCFFFDSSFNECCEIVSEIPTIQSTFILDTSSNMKMRFLCNTIGYNTGQNDLYLQVTPLPNQTKYDIYQYRDRINASFIKANQTYNNIFQITPPLSVIDNIFDMKLQLKKTFNQTNCKIIIDPSSLLVQYFGFTPGLQVDLSSNNILQNTFIPQSAGYVYTDFNSYNIFTLSTNNTNGNGMADISVNLIVDPITSFNISFNNYIDLTNAIQNAIQNTEINTIIGINNSIINYPLFNTSFVTSSTSSDTEESHLTINYSFSLSQSNYSIYYDSSENNWSYFDISASYDLSQKINSLNSSYAEINGDILGGELLKLTVGNNIIKINTNTVLPNIPNNVITIQLLVNNSYTLSDLYNSINYQLSTNPLTYGSSISTYVSSNNKSYTKLRITVNDIYTASDYYLDFYDPISFSTCLPTSSSIQNTTWDSTVGWILGFRDYTQYYLTQQNQTSILIGNTTQTYYMNSPNGQYTINTNPIQNTQYNDYIVTLTGDTTLSTNLYNYFLISLDDYIQNHLNDGLVTITRNQTALSVPSYAYSTTTICDPATNTKVSRSLPQTNSDNVTAKQLYALNQTMQSNNNPVKTYSSGPFIKDLFGIIPIKPGTNGTYYIEFGGTLQNQERVYFGPVNIRKMTIQLLNDRGDIVDLNGSNWSFSFICEQLYRDNSS